MKKFSSKKSAFSLIELSIVLIIIGLLIAGITGGASLIKNSELRSAIGEARGYAVAVNGFYSQYNALPGDYPKAIAGSTIYSAATTGNGDNGRIEYWASDVIGVGSTTDAEHGCYTSNSVSTSVGCTSESVAAWKQLIATGTIDSTLALTFLKVGAAQIPGTNMPASKIKFAGWHFDYRTGVGAAFVTTNVYTTTAYATIVNEGGVPAPQNVVVLTGTTAAATGTDASSAISTLVNGTTNAATASLTGSDALAIDTKADDGKANTGKIRGLNPAATTGCYASSETTAADYIISSATSKVCALTFQVDVKG